MKRRDPVEVVLGRDAASVVHRIIFQMRIKDVIEEYRDRVWTQENDSVWFVGSIPTRYNHRAWGSTALIRNYNDVITGKLPQHYWGLPPPSNEELLIRSRRRLMEMKRRQLLEYLETEVMLEDVTVGEDINDV